MWSTFASAFPASVHLVHDLVEPVLMEQVQEAAAIRGASVAGWLRHALRQIRLEDFPASWHTEEATPRSHEAGYYRREFGLRLDDETSRKLETLAKAFQRSAAEVVRELILHARPEDFPESWHFTVQAHPEEGNA